MAAGTELEALAGTASEAAEAQVDPTHPSHLSHCHASDNLKLTLNDGIDTGINAAVDTTFRQDLESDSESDAQASESLSKSRLRVGLGRHGARKTVTRSVRFDALPVVTPSRNRAARRSIIIRSGPGIAPANDSEVLALANGTCNDAAGSEPPPGESAAWIIPKPSGFAIIESDSESDYAT